MAKDPAILFYTSDFLTGTMFMSNEEKGQYITLLCLQHQKGHLSEDELSQLTDKSSVRSKFVLADDGKYHNIRMHEETLKRSAYCESRRKNKVGSPKPVTSLTHDEHMTNISSTHVGHMEDENANTICVDVSSSAKGITTSKVYVKEDPVSERNKRIIDDLNAVCSTSYKHNTPQTVEMIATRIKEGFTEQDFYTVHRNMFATWSLDTKMREFLRPITLYSNKFESYLNKVVNVELDKYSDAAKKTMQNCANFIKNMEKQNA